MPNQTNLFSGVPNEFPPLKQDMWSILFPIEMGLSERFQVSASRPSVSNAVVDVKYKGATFKYRGNTTVEDMTIKFRDVVGPAVMAKLWAWQKEHFDFITGCGGYPSQYKKNLILLMEDDCGNPVQKWILYGAFIKSLAGGDLDQKSTGEIVEVTLVVAYDYPQMEY